MAPMSKNQFEYLENHQISLAYLGKLSSKRVLLFMGRNNQQKQSIPLEELVTRLPKEHYLLVWPESKNQATSQFLMKKSKRLLLCLDWAFDPNDCLLKSYLRRCIKTLILIFYPSKWDYFLHSLTNSEIDHQTQVARQEIATLGKNKAISVFSHSAGGIAASNLLTKTNVKNAICFGYPFKHPDREDEPYRTINLQTAEKPFLIIQGKCDVYGGQEVKNLYPLSPNIEFEFVQATHEYENLTNDDWEKILHRIESFLDKDSLDGLVV